MGRSYVVKYFHKIGPEDNIIAWPLAHNRASLNWELERQGLIWCSQCGAAVTPANGECPYHKEE